MLFKQDRQMTLSRGNSSKEEHNWQKEGKKISSANFVEEESLLRRKEIKKILPLPFPGNQCNRESRE